MQDIRLKQDVNGIYDIQLDADDFESVDGFETAIAVSYFTDSRAPSVQVQNAQNRRGWIGNILTAIESRELGGLLWILDQARITEDTLNFARTFAKESLQWIIDDGLARSVSVSVERDGSRGIVINTDIVAIDNTVSRYVSLWRNTILERLT